jgi:hypothetical protein
MAEASVRRRGTGKPDPPTDVASAPSHANEHPATGHGQARPTNGRCIRPFIRQRASGDGGWGKVPVLFREGGWPGNPGERELFCGSRYPTPDLSL